MSGGEFEDPIYNEHTITTNNIKMYKFSAMRGIGIDQSYCIFEKNNTVFEIQYGTNEHDDIISTFKFTN